MYTSTTVIPPKPHLRGALHFLAFLCAIPGAMYLLVSPSSLSWSMGIYAFSLMGLFGISALYHRIEWSPRVYDWLGIVDRVMIYVFIAANCTPFVVFAMTDPLSTILLSVLWGSVLLGVIVNLFFLNSANWIHSVLYVAVGGACALGIPQLASNLGSTAMFWIILGGAVHVIGAVLYALRKPNPIPDWFEFHEVFHLCVTVAICIHYGVVVSYLIPVA